MNILDQYQPDEWTGIRFSQVRFSVEGLFTPLDPKPSHGTVQRVGVGTCTRPVLQVEPVRCIHGVILIRSSVERRVDGSAMDPTWTMHDSMEKGKGVAGCDTMKVTTH